MKRICALLVVVQAALLLVPMSFAKTHKDNYPVSCDMLWRAVKDAVRNSGKYGIVGVDNAEMSVSYVVGGTLGGKRINSVVLNRLSDTSCEMQTQTAFSGITHNDAGDFKKRVDSSLAKLSAEKSSGQPVSSENAATTNTATDVAPKPEPGAASDATTANSPAASNMVKLSVDPGVAGAEIELDGAFVGTTPSVLEIKPGEYDIKIAKPGYKPWQRKIKALNGTINVSPQLEKEQTSEGK